MTKTNEALFILTPKKTKELLVLDKRTTNADNKYEHDKAN